MRVQYKVHGGHWVTFSHAGSLISATEDAKRLRKQGHEVRILSAANQVIG